MPQYSFQHPKTKKVITINQKMTEEHVYVDEKGVKWDRIFEVPQTRIDSLGNIDPWDSKKFVERTGKSRGQVGDLHDLSIELGEKRKKVLGQDPVYKKMIDKYRHRTGKKHPAEYKKN